MKVPMPSVDEVDMLPPRLEHVVPSSWEDLNGHVNFQHYLELLDLAGDAMFADLGLDKTYVATHRRGFFELEHHIWYLNELHVGDLVSVHVRYVDRTQKRFHGNAFIVNRTRRQLACVFEYVSSAVDLDARRTTALAADVAARLDALIAGHRRLAWPAPRCGVIRA